MSLEGVSSTEYQYLVSNYIVSINIMPNYYFRCAFISFMSMAADVLRPRSLL